MTGFKVSSPGRDIPIKGVPNFRDFGGYPGADGRNVHRGLLYRSSAVSGLTNVDFEQLTSLNVALVCDLRTEEERSKAPNALEDHDATEVLNLDIGSRERIRGVPATPLLTDLEATAADARERIQGFYAEAVIQYADCFATMLHSLLDHNRLPVLVHCTAGKDRTGIASAIILRALGVSAAIAVEDYLRTNDHLSLPWRRQMIAQMFPGNPPINDAAADVMFSADASFLEAALASIDKEFGSFDTYLIDALSIGPREQTRLRKMLLD